jgi:hypothetical protein
VINSKCTGDRKRPEKNINCCAGEDAVIEMEDTRNTRMSGGLKQPPGLAIGEACTYSLQPAPGDTTVESGLMPPPIVEPIWPRVWPGL